MENLSIYKYIFFLIAIIYFFLSLNQFVGAGRDDTFITLWAGENLTSGRIWVNYNLEPSEMSSSFLHSLLVALINKLLPNYTYSINKVLGLVAGGITLTVISVSLKSLMVPLNRTMGVVSLSLILFSLATFPSWLYWNLGGLETPFQTLILLLLGITYYRYWMGDRKALIYILFLQSLYVLIRPEGFLLIVFTGIFSILNSIKSKENPIKRLITLIGVPIGVFMLITVARYFSLGMLFPNPVYAKAGLSDTGLYNFYLGIKYLIGFYKSSPYTILQLAIMLYAFITIIYQIALKKIVDIQTAIFLGLILTNHFFIILVGGNWMEYYRFIVPVIPFIIIITIHMISNLVTLLINRFAKIGTVFILLFVISIGSLAIANFKLQKDHPDGFGAPNASLQNSINDILHNFSLTTINERIIQLNDAHKRDWDAMMPFIQNELPEVYDQLGKRITIVTYQMGFFPYFIKRLHPELNIEFIDTMGLGDRNIAKMPLSKNSFGVIDGKRIDLVVSGKSGILSKYVNNKQPNLIYMLGASSEQTEILSKLGWKQLWVRPGGVIFSKGI